MARSTGRRRRQARPARRSAPQGVVRSVDQLRRRAPAARCASPTSMQEQPIQEIWAYDVGAGAEPEGHASSSATRSMPMPRPTSPALDAAQRLHRRPLSRRTSAAPCVALPRRASRPRSAPARRRDRRRRASTAARRRADRPYPDPGRASAMRYPGQAARARVGLWLGRISTTGSTASRSTFPR